MHLSKESLYLIERGVCKVEIKIQSLLKKPGKKLEVVEEYEPAALDLNLEHVRIVSPLEINVELEHTGEGIIRGQGSYEVDLQVDCGRCLKPVPNHRENTIAGVFVPGDNTEEVEMKTGEYRVGYEGETLSLWELIRQDLLVGVPMQVICSEDCKGLCSVCGQDLNEEDCGHKQKKIDPRLAKLKEIKIEED